MNHAQETQYNNRARARLFKKKNLLSMFSAFTAQYDEGTPEAEQGVTSLEYIKLNGLKHAVLIRGKDRGHPILLHVHGLGVPSMCFAHDEYSGGAEKEGVFTVVHYDQRGFGKTYCRGQHWKKQTTIARYTEDLEALVAYLLERFRQPKLFLLAESWGTTLGAHIVSRHPEWFYAYLAVPQIGEVGTSLADAYDFSLAQAQADKNDKATEELKKYGAPSPGMSNGRINRALAKMGKWMDHYNMKRYGGKNMTGYFYKSLWEAPEYSVFDFVNTLKGFQNTSPKLNRLLIDVNIAEDVPEMKAPVYFIIGEYDLYLSSSKAYFDRLKADKKYWLPIKNAGHMVRGEQYQAFDDILYKKILPETYRPLT